MNKLTLSSMWTIIILMCFSFSLAESVEVALVDELDGILNGYCLDIAGGNQNVDPANGLQGHTCYSYQGDLGTDQVFDTEKFENNILYMPIYDVCVEVVSIEAGSEVGLATCVEDNDLQSFTFANGGVISPVSNPELCLQSSIFSSRNSSTTL